jgi:hypothetical protein
MAAKLHRCWHMPTFFSNFYVHPPSFSLWRASS